ncbi:MAG: hypothetical protein KA247_02340 [Bacteroidetes bacterium]|nr:hypothetical protein [Bacteroidota bacterium]
MGFIYQVSGSTTLKIYDAIGREVATLANENLEAGAYHQRIVDASRFSSGFYSVKMISSGDSRKKMLL